MDTLSGFQAAAALRVFDILYRRKEDDPDEADHTDNGIRQADTGLPQGIPGKR